ncbi:MAG: NmrA family protein [Sphingomonas bacterium]|uniref:NmrA family NAD(P)-binding protein n=1 Tax=Sphingomonas bacterium TaxID=1895847 RepID=UPI002615654D|nr:NmrA family NAD(P)-binding protein [Sphingomonas bacterium]MDB5704950.1 NmrA family protein [Sphingomonas bacterium]
MFAITAITGKVGGAVARTLLDAGRQVRAVVRDAAKGAPWAALGCEVAIADLSDAAPLAAAFAGTEGVFVLLPPVFDPAPGFPDATAHIAVIREALVRAAPPRVVVLSTIGADSDRPNLLNALRLLEQALADLPMPITFLRAAWFMENAAWDVASAREQGVIHSYLQPLDRPVPMIATDDVGSTAAALLREDWTGHRIVELEAIERVTPNAIAAAFADALGKPVEAQIVPRADWEGIFRDQGMQNPLPRMQMVDGFNAGWIDFRDGGAQARKGRIAIGAVVAALVGKDSA